MYGYWARHYVARMSTVKPRPVRLVVAEVGVKLPMRGFAHDNELKTVRIEQKPQKCPPR